MFFRAEFELELPPPAPCRGATLPNSNLNSNSRLPPFRENNVIPLRTELELERLPPLLWQKLWNSNSNSKPDPLQFESEPNSSHPSGATPSLRPRSWWIWRIQRSQCQLSHQPPQCQPQSTTAARLRNSGAHGTAFMASN